MHGPMTIDVLSFPGDIRNPSVISYGRTQLDALLELPVLHHHFIFICLVSVLVYAVRHHGHSPAWSSYTASTFASLDAQP
jgi:hypothetical protein